MAHEYHFPAPSPLSRLVIGKNPSDRMEATLYAAPCEDTQLLQRLPRLFARQGLSCYADESEGKPVLKVTGFGHRPDVVLETVRQSGITTPPPNETKNERERANLKDRFRKNTVRLSGVFGELGHAAMLTSGFIVKDYSRVLTAATYATSTSLQAAFGNGKGGIPFARMTHDLRDYFLKEGVVLPDPNMHTPEVAHGERSWGQKTWEGIKSHPIEISSAIGLVGNLSLLRSGVQDMRFNGTRAGFGRALSGGTAAVGAIASILVPEASKAEVEKMRQRKSLIRMVADGQWGAALKEAPQRGYDLVRRSPLGFFGILNLINNAGLVHAAIEEKQKFQTALHGGDRQLYRFGFFRNGVEHVASHQTRIDTLAREISHAAATPLLGEGGTHNFFRLNRMRAEHKLLVGELEGITRRPWAWRFAVATAILYPVASLMMVLSSKKRDKSLESKNAYGEMYAYGANLVLGLSPAKQQKLIDKMGEYLSAQPDVKVGADEIRAGIAAKLAVINTGPWNLAQAPAAEVAASPPENAGPSWRARVDAAKEQAAAHGASHSMA